MRLVIQRVKSASVTVNYEKEVRTIGPGLLILIAVKRGDVKKDAEILADKLLKLRILSDSKNKMNLSVTEKKEEIMVISQFTLYADTSKGNRPSFIKAADPIEAKNLYQVFIERLKNSGVGVATGRFGDYMHIKNELDGPVTIILES